MRGSAETTTTKPTAAETASAETAPMETTATACVTASSPKTSTATKSSSPTTSVASRRCDRAEAKKSEANYANYSFCFHVLRSGHPRFVAIARPGDFLVSHPGEDPYSLLRVRAMGYT